MTRIVCKRYSALLGPYSEGTLSPAEAARTEAHLKECAACRADLATLQQVAHLLRGCKPAVPEPSADLWSRIQAEIQPAAPAYGAPRSWRRAGFGVSLGGLAVAALAVFLVRPWAEPGAPTAGPGDRLVVARTAPASPGVPAGTADPSPAPPSPAVERAPNPASAPKLRKPAPARPPAASQVAEDPFSSMAADPEAAAEEAPKPRARPRRPTPVVVATVLRKEKAAPPAAKPPARVAAAASPLTLDFAAAEPEARTYGLQAERRSEWFGPGDSRAAEESLAAGEAASRPPDAVRPGARIVVRVHPKPVGASVASVEDVPAAGDSAVDAALDEQRQRSLFRYTPR